MIQIAKSALVLTAVFLVLSPLTLSQEKAEHSVSPTIVPSPYPNTADGLRLLLRDTLTAAKIEDKEKVAAFVNDLEIPNYQAWFYRTYAEENAESWAGPYGANLDKNKKFMQELFVQLAQKEGELFTRKVNDSPDPGKGLEWGMLQALKQPVDIYFASWKKPDDPKDSRGEPIGYFMFIDGKFRLDSLIRFARIIPSTPTSEQTVAPGTVPSPQQHSVQQQPLSRVRLSPEVSQGMVVRRVYAQYPLEAKSKGIQGTVNMLAIISTSGEVAELKLIDGDPLLAAAAMVAVKQWKYRPYLMQGNPVEVETTVTYIFTLAGRN